MIETGFTCTGGDWFNHDICDEICGDGLNIGFHQCDDGNLIVGDGCNHHCQKEVGWFCNYGTPT